MIEEGSRLGDALDNGGSREPDAIASLTWRMVGLLHPESISCVSNHVVVPFDNQVPCCRFQQRRAREAMDIQLRFWRHGKDPLDVTGSDVLLLALLLAEMTTCTVCCRPVAALAGGSVWVHGDDSSHHQTVPAIH